MPTTLLLAFILDFVHAALGPAKDRHLLEFCLLCWIIATHSALLMARTQTWQICHSVNFHELSPIFICSFSSYFRGSYYEPGTLLGTKDVGEIKANVLLLPGSLLSW